jgi:hypothetical protein
MDIRRTKPGFTVASTAPLIIVSLHIWEVGRYSHSRNRFVAMPAKLVHAGVVMRIIPHPIVAKLKNFPIGNLCNRYPEGN